MSRESLMLSIFQKVNYITRLARSIEHFFDVVPTKLEAIYAVNRRQSIQLDLQNKLLVHIVGLLWSQDTDQIDDEMTDEVNASSARLLKMNGFQDGPETRVNEASRKAANERLASFGSVKIQPTHQYKEPGDK